MDFGPNGCKRNVDEFSDYISDLKVQGALVPSATYQDSLKASSLRKKEGNTHMSIYIHIYMCLYIHYICIYNIHI